MQGDSEIQGTDKLHSSMRHKNGVCRDVNLTGAPSTEGQHFCRILKSDINISEQHSPHFFFFFPFPFCLLLIEDARWVVLEITMQLFLCSENAQYSQLQKLVHASLSLPPLRGTKVILFSCSFALHFLY